MTSVGWYGGTLDVATAVDGRAAGIKGWIVKPFKGNAVLPAFKKMVDA